MTNKLLPTRTTILLVLGTLIAGLMLPGRPMLALGKPATTDTSEDWRYEQVGIWDCQGTMTLSDGQASPYYGRLRNYWSEDGASLILRFSQYHPSGQPFKEEQRWDYLETTGSHSRILSGNDGSSAVLISTGHQDNVMQWEGSFITEQGAAQFSETITRLSSEEYHWLGEITLGEQMLAVYQLTCAKLSN